MPQYKLTYFDARGRGETSRLVMAYGGIQFEDVRLSRDQFNQIKSDLPMGQLPLLEVDGQVLCQSLAINRYLAKQAGLMGNTDLDDAKIDMIVGCFEDFMRPLIQVFREQDEEKKKTLCEKEIKELPARTKKLENLVSGEYFVANQLTLADITATHWLDEAPSRLNYEYNWDDYPKLKAMRERVSAEPKIAAWIAKRPEKPYTNPGSFVIRPEL